MEKATENLMRAGEIFMYTVWLQSQMSDLLILKKYPELITSFVNNSEKVPPAMAQLRAIYWEKHFSAVKDEFCSAFADALQEQELKDLENVLHTRNMIAHAHVSLGRNFMLYRPGGGEKKEQALTEALNLKPIEGQAKPFMLKLEFWRDDLYLNVFSRIKRIDEGCFERLCQSIAVPHGRIR